MRHAAIAIALLALIAAIYGHTPRSPFMMDDWQLVADNPIIKDLNYFAHPGLAKGQPEYTIFRTRYISMLTLALNYRVHGLAVEGYHLTNICLHAINTLLLYALVLMLYRTPRMVDAHGQWAALAAAVLFAVHPLQTEVVTYIVGRTGLLSAMFSLGTVFLYVAHRLRPGDYALLAASALCALLAMLSKQNAAMLPVLVLLVEWAFLEGSPQRYLRCLPYVLALGVFPLTMSAAGMSPVEIMRAAQGVSGSMQDRGSAFDADYVRPALSSWQYLLTQTNSVLLYLRLLVLPVGQSIDHDVTARSSVTEPGVIAAMLLHLCIIGACVAAYVRYSARMVLFGVAWFYVALSVESSVLPIPMLTAEYRAYLPSAGIFAAVGAGVAMVPRRAGLVMLICATLILGALAHQRNSLWQSPGMLWKDAALKSPGKVRPLYNAATLYADEGQYETSAELYERALELAPADEQIYNNLAGAYHSLGRVEDSIAVLKRGMDVSPRDASLRGNLGGIYLEQGMFHEAAREFELAVKLDPQNPLWQERLWLALEAAK